ncbi:MAG: class III extradiol ring-cleavage dioxygenase [Alphaproteobacteria bacterium]|nr:class III extradiol ring-cleavage dioxygenase [Alphaproteobacteria bacterium]
MPALFVSHGSPMIVLDQSSTRVFLEGYAATLPRPKAILVVTAHFEAAQPTLTAAQRPPMIYDFGSFPEALYTMTYPAPGAPALAMRAAELLQAAGFAPRTDATRGFDHGTWTPLKLLYPDADIPVGQLSVDPRRNARWHFELGEALAPLRDEGVLIVGSGSLTHDLSAFFGRRPPGGPSPKDYAAAFAAWMTEKVEAGRIDDVLDWAASAPEALRNHPTPEHILPLFVALGAGGPQRRRVHQAMDHDVLSMDAYAFASA